MKKLGTILPNREIMRLGDELHAKNVLKREAIGREKLSDCKIRQVGLDTRYYRTPTLYAEVCRDYVIRWFEVRSDGEYAIRGK